MGLFWLSVSLRSAVTRLLEVTLLLHQVIEIGGMKSHNPIRKQDIVKIKKTL